MVSVPRCISMYVSPDHPPSRNRSHVLILIKAGGVGGVQAALTALASTGCEVAITELDIVNAASSDYLTVLQACLNTPSCVSITTWGVSDANSWRSSSNPLLYDRNYQPKAAFNAILSALGTSDTTTTTATTTTPTTSNGPTTTTTSDTPTSTVKPPSSDSDSLNARFLAKGRKFWVRVYPDARPLLADKVYRCRDLVLTQIP